MSFLIGWIILLAFIPAKELVDLLGVNNAYASAFLLAVLAGGSSLTAGPFYVVLSTLAQGGLSIFWLAILAGAGAMVGDTFYYFAGRKSGEAITGWMRKIFDKLNHYLHKYPKLTPLFIFIYAGLFPAPNDPLTISLGLSRYSYKKLFVPLMLGNMTFFFLFLYGVLEVVTRIFS